MPQFNRSIERVGSILNLFSPSKPVWGVSEIAQELGISIVTANNFVRTLEKIGFLDQDDNSRKYKLGTRILGIGTVIASNLELNQRGGALAIELSSRSGLGCRLGVWDKDAALTIFRAEPGIRPSLGTQFGPRVVAYCTAMGRALLAYFEPAEIDLYFKNAKLISITPKTKTDPDEIMEELEQTRNRGFSINNEEMLLGQKTIGAPIFYKHNKVAGVICIGGEADILIDTVLDNIVKELKDTALQISCNMGYWPGSP